MDICIFYSWQSLYKKNCDVIIDKALKKAVNELNTEQANIHYVVKRGGGDVEGIEHIDTNIDKIIKTQADIAIVDFTHNGNAPKKDEITGNWITEKCAPNSNVVYETGKLELALGVRQVFCVYNTAYGDLRTNLKMPFDLRQWHFPVPFCCDDDKDIDERKRIRENLKKDIKERIKGCTNAYLENRKVRYAPLVPLHNEFSKTMWQTEFKDTAFFCILRDRITKGQSFRLLGLPGLGKTRMVCEAFRGRDNDVYYCDCRDQGIKEVEKALESLMSHRSNIKQTVILDNCSQRLSTIVIGDICENGYNCQLITIYYDPREDVDSGIEGIVMKVGDTAGVVEEMLDEVKGMPKEVKASIIELSGGFPLMAKVMIENYEMGAPIVNIKKKDVFERMLGLDSANAPDQDKMKVLTAFSIFKFIGLYGQQEKQGRFIAGNKIITNIRGSADDNLQLFKDVYALYSKKEILERQGNLVLMRLIPLAIFFCKLWFDCQTTDSIGELIEQIRTLDDEGTRGMLIESLSRRITLLSEVPLAKELSEGLTDPDSSPFLSEEVVLSALGSRLFLAFSEVNPEACAYALHRIIVRKTDDEIIAIEPARRNLAWALDRLAFDKRSFRYAMLTLARFSAVETEAQLSNNTTGLFVDRFPIMLPGTEIDLMSRLDVLKELSNDNRYDGLIKKSLNRALSTGHFFRSGGAEKQGFKILTDYVPTYQEVELYLNACFNFLMSRAKNPQDIDDIAEILASNARGYYLEGMDSFLIRGLEVIAPLREYVWEEMKDSLAFLIEYDGKKRENYRIDIFTAWEKKLTQNDYVYTLLHLGKEISRHMDYSFEKEMKVIQERYCEMAKELVDKQLYKDNDLVSRIMRGKCLYYNSYGDALSSYSKEVGLQKELLEVLLHHVLHLEASRDGESLLIYFMQNVDEEYLLEYTYDIITDSPKKYLLPAIYAVKNENEMRLASLFCLLDKEELKLNDFAGYFLYRTLNTVNVKYIVRRLLDYGSEGAELVLSHCHNLLFGNESTDQDYKALGRRCLLMVNLRGVQKNDYVYLQSMSYYLDNYQDEEMALHIHDLQEQFFMEHFPRENYYIGRLYRKALRRYPNLLKPKLLVLLEDEKVRHAWVDLLRTNYPQEHDGGEPTYMLISMEEWFDWLKQAERNNRAYVLALMISYANGESASPAYLKLLNDYWCDEVRSALSSRFHTFSWTGTGIPLYQNRITICKDYIAKLTNQEAKEWFKDDIRFWECEVEKEQLQNAHERAIFN